MSATTKDSGTEAVGRESGKALSFAISHKLRVEILVALNNGPKSPSQLAEETREPIANVVHHIKELLRSGSIERAEERRDGNLVQTMYRAVAQSKYTTEELREMSYEEQRTVIAMALQNALAEHLAAFNGHKMRGDDPTLALSWRWFNVDPQGREEISEELAETWNRICDIEARSVARRSSSREPESIVVSLIGHPRVRPGRDFVQLVDLGTPPPTAPRE
jgi:DNA-binding transcriptional ArsR family regulator